MSAGLTKEQMRNARLRALGLATEEPSTTGAATMEDSIASDHVGTKLARTNTTRTVEQNEVGALMKLMYRGGNATEEDMLRWYSQGFGFCQEPHFGLKQGNGGPCGILAVIQAEMLREIMFVQNQGEAKTRLHELGEHDMSQVLATAVCNVLHRAADGNEVKILHLEGNSRGLPMQHWEPAEVTVTSYVTKEDARIALCDSKLQELLMSPMGCVVFLVSLIYSRGLEKLVADMDDSSNTLIGQFGHCNQDLINLLLTGRATSNVMDGEVQLGDSGLTVKGVYQRSTIGYLSHLEAMRYCEVGSYLKVPEHPIWVVGSSSHFSVLFSLDRKVNEESASQKLLSTLQRCFKSVDRDECGYIPAAALKEALSQINVHSEYSNSPILDVISNDTDLARLRGHLQIDGEIILWSSFWVSLSSLMSGRTLDELISIPPELPLSQGAASSSTALIPLPDGSVANAPYENSNLGPYFNNSSAVSGEKYDAFAPQGGRARSDSEIARELQAEIDGELLLESAGQVVPMHQSHSASSSSGFGGPGIASGNLNASISALNFSSLTSANNSNFNNFTSSSFPALGAAGASSSSSSAFHSAPTASAAPAPAPAPAPVAAAPLRERSDSELARELQAQWDAEDAAGNTSFNNPFLTDEEFPPGTTRTKHSSSMDVNTGNVDFYDDIPDLVPVTDSFATPTRAAQSGDYNSKMPAQSSTAWKYDDIGSSTETFTMYHFNGLENSGRTAKLTPFTLSVRSSVDAVGVSIGFEGGEHGSAGGTSFLSPIEEVLRTRWPGCTVNWEDGQLPPSID